MRLNEHLAGLIKAETITIRGYPITGLLEPVLKEEGEGFGLRVASTNQGEDLLAEVTILFP